jgi:predicted nucleic acid-binding protein
LSAANLLSPGLVGISDVRIAAACIVHTANLLSRNRRDFDFVRDP